MKKLLFIALAVTMTACSTDEAKTSNTETLNIPEYFQGEWLSEESPTALLVEEHRITFGSRQIITAEILEQTNNSLNLQLPDNKRLKLVRVTQFQMNVGYTQGEQSIDGGLFLRQ